MVSIETKSKTPVGMGKEINKFVNTGRNKNYLVRFHPVDNTVIEVNPDIHSPFKLTVGEPTPLGVFASGFKEGRDKKGKWVKMPVFECWTPHRRSALLGRVIFADRQGRMYRDLDIKGVGYIDVSPYSGPNIKWPGGKVETGGLHGLLGEESARFDLQMSEEFSNAGIRTYRTVAIVELKEIVIGGKLISVKEAYERGLVTELTEDFHPVAQIRAYGTRARIDDAQHTDPAFSQLLLGDAQNLVSQELGLANFTSGDYMEWFAKTLGENVGLMHKNGWSHNYLTGHNITLDCRIVDLDGVRKLSSKKEMYQDVNLAFNSLTLFVDSSGFFQSRYYTAICDTAYNSIFSPEERLEYFSRKKR